MHLTLRFVYFAAILALFYGMVRYEDFLEKIFFILICTVILGFFASMPFIAAWIVAGWLAGVS